MSIALRNRREAYDQIEPKRPNRKAMILDTVGNGNTKMVADPGSADAYLNRRTDVFFKIIEE